MHVRNGHFGGRYQEILGAGDLERILLEFRQLTGALHAAAVHHKRREHLCIAALKLVRIKEHADNGAL
ncbi:hypothetical protein SDC9_182778 [bioreactor metagenome]|uniref:Uncharacterized protein n=1 Tax=bioreactor metagenome TaxID=1076179 RepID=A0A645H8C1_9ZZZZ